jgi:hypothetical protein
VKAINSPILIEVNGPGGFYCEIARAFHSAVRQELVDAFAYAGEPKTLPEPAQPAPIRKTSWRQQRIPGPQENTSPNCASMPTQATRLVERPFFLNDETMKINRHERHRSPRRDHRHGLGRVCDNYMVGPDGPGECLHRTRRKSSVVS